MQRAGRYPPPPGGRRHARGLECAGETEAPVVRLARGRCQASSGVRVPTPVPEHEWERGRRRDSTAHDALFTQAELRPASACS